MDDATTNLTVMSGPTGAGLLLAVALAGTLGGPASASQPAPREFVLSPEGNHLWAYDASTLEHQLVVQARNGADPGTTAPNGLRRDINGQICVSPDQTHVVTGEDTAVGGDSHDPRIAGWGWFTIEGDELGEITMVQTGKLAPEAEGTGPGYAGDPDNFGCGFLDGDRLVTTAIGDRFPGQPANGQLFLWFAPFEAGFEATAEGFFAGAVPHCEIDGGLATAGGIAVDRANGHVYVAANRPSEFAGGDPAAVWRYSGTWPSSIEECTPAFVEANITKELVVDSPLAPTPSSVALSPAGTLFLSSVFTGTVSEFTTDGQWLRDVYPASPVAPRTGPTGDTPFGLAVTSDGSLWIADLGIVVAETGPGLGSVVRVPFAGGAPQRPATVRDGLDFPDGLGVYAPAATVAAPEPPAAGPGPVVEGGTVGAELARSGGGAMLFAIGAPLLAAALLVRRVAR